MSAHEPRDFAYIALGANLPSEEGDPLATLKTAASRLQSLSRQPLQLSSWWETMPVDCPPDSPRYINGMAALIPLPEENPLSLLHTLQAIERDFGRRRSGVVNEARVLDLDLIAWGDHRNNTEALTLPHPRAHKRGFVLAPLAELAPDLVLPGQHKSVADLLSSLPDQGLKRIA